jgi:hypothetical protein
MTDKLTQVAEEKFNTHMIKTATPELRKYAIDWALECLGYPDIDDEKNIESHWHMLNVYADLICMGANWQQENGEQKWQLCPKCNGEGYLPNIKPYTTTAPMTIVCDVCNGAKILPTPPTEQK